MILLLIFSAAVSIADLYAAGSAVEFNNWSERFNVIYFSNQYPEYTISLSASLGSVPEKPFKPWTNQIRASGFVPINDGVIIAVNSGYPVLMFEGAGGSVEISSPREAAIRQFLEASSGLTIGTVFSNTDSAFFHFYRDDFFNSSISNQNDSLAAKEAHPVLIEIGLGDSGDFSFTNIDYDFSIENPEWEPVEYIRKNDGSYIAWKYTDEKKTRFRYIRHGRDGESVSEIDEGFFRDEYNLLPINAESFALRGFIKAARDGSVGSVLADAGDIYIRSSVPSSGSSDEGFPVYYHSQAPEQPAFSEKKLPVQLPACPDDDLWYILIDDEIMVCGSNITRWSLPELPEGFSYDQLWVRGSNMIVSWEERRFPYIGRAGMMYIQLRDIIN